MMILLKKFRIKLTIKIYTYLNKCFIYILNLFAKSRTKKIET